LIAAERNGSGDGDDNGEKWDQGDKGDRADDGTVGREEGGQERNIDGEGRRRASVGGGGYLLPVMVVLGSKTPGKI
jgi:hypothetical protein